MPKIQPHNLTIMRIPLPPRSVFSLRYLTLLLLALTGVSVFAQNGSRTWTGTTNGDFYNGDNWDASGDFPNSYATFGDNGTYATVTNTTITRSSGSTYPYLYGLYFNNTLGTQSSFTIGATPSSGTQINWGGPEISTATVTSGSLTDTINSDIALVGSNATQYAKELTTNANHDLILNGVISGGNTTDYSFTKAGAGKLTLGGSNTYDVVTTVNAGTLEVTHQNALGSTTAGTVVNDGATLRLDFGTDNNVQIAESFTLNGSGDGSTGALSVKDAQINADITLGSDATINVTGTGTFRLDHNGALHGANNTLTKTGAGAMVRSKALNNTNLIVAEGEYLITGSDAAGDSNSSITVQSGAKLTLWATGATGAPVIVFEDGSEYQTNRNTANSTSINGTMELKGAVDFKSWNTDHTIHSNISGVGGITLVSHVNGQDSAKYTMTGTNTYTGATTVGNGSGDALGKMTLIINGDNSAATGTVTVTNGSTLGGSGIIGGATTIQSGGTLTAGNSPGVLTFNDDLTLDSGSTTIMEITGTTRGTEYDGIDVSGLLTYGGGLTITSDTEIAYGVYDLFGINGTESGDFSTVTLAGLAYNEDALVQSGDLWTATIGSKTYSFSQLTGDLTVIPEPATYALLGGLLVLSAAALRRPLKVK